MSVKKRVVHLRGFLSRQVPLMRVVGFALLTIAAILHNELLFGLSSPLLLPVVVPSIALYVVAAWIVSRAFRRSRQLEKLSDLLFALDLAAFGLLIVASGGEKSLLFFAFMARAADQAHRGSRKTLVFVHLGIIAYLTSVWFTGKAESRALDWNLVGIKTAVLYSFSLYMTLTATVSERFRQRVRRSVEFSRQLVDELTIERRRVQQANRAKDQFMANMSHELRTPIHSILGASGLLAAQSDDEHHLHYSEIIETAGKSLLVFVDEILDLSKIEAGVLELHMTEFRLESVIEDVFKSLGVRASQKGLQLSAQVEPGLPDRLRSDPVRLRQILLNLVGNAIKFTVDGTVRIEVSRSPKKPKSARFEILDTGPGFAAEKINHLFEPFVQGDESLTREHGGAGVGLALSQRMVHLLGGEIGGSNRPSGGAALWFELPLEEPELVATASTPTVLAELSEASDRRFRALLVEDDAIVRMLAARHLESLGLDVVLATTGTEAIEALSRSGVDLILMDCQMPSMDGYAATREIRRLEGEQRHTPIVALTAHATARDRSRCIEAGMDDYLAKPFAVEALTEKIRLWAPQSVEETAADAVPSSLGRTSKTS